MILLFRGFSRFPSLFRAKYIQTLTELYGYRTRTHRDKMLRSVISTRTGTCLGLSNNNPRRCVSLLSGPGRAIPRGQQSPITPTGLPPLSPLLDIRCAVRPARRWSRSTRVPNGTGPVAGSPRRDPRPHAATPRQDGFNRRAGTRLKQAGMRKNHRSSYGA